MRVQVTSVEEGQGRVCERGGQAIPRHLAGVLQCGSLPANPVSHDLAEPEGGPRGTGPY
jgi:hypothetical protein